MRFKLVDNRDGRGYPRNSLASGEEGTLRKRDVTSREDSTRDRDARPDGLALNRRTNVEFHARRTDRSNPRKPLRGDRLRRR